MNKTPGFTLVELLVVMAILSLLGTLAVTIFVRTLRANNKSQIILTIKQNGQTALDTLDKNIRNSDSIVCVSNEISDTPPIKGRTVVFDKGGSFTRYRMVLAVADATNGYIVQDNPEPVTSGCNPPLNAETCEIIPLPDQTFGITTSFINSVCSAANPMDNPTILTDTNTQTGISVKNGSFIRMKQSGFRDVVAIDFMLGPGEKAPSVVAGQIDPVQFQTTIGLR